MSKSKRVEYLEYGDVEKILKFLDESDNEMLRIIVELFFYSALRLSEAHAVRPGDIDFDNGLVHLPYTKGDKPRDVPVTFSTLDHLKYYVKHNRAAIDARTVEFDRAVEDHLERLRRRADKQKLDVKESKRFVHREIMRYIRTELKSPLFGIKYGSIQKAIIKLPGRAGVNARISPHILRHSFVRYALKMKKDLPRISRMLGHSSIQVTADVYGHMDNRAILEEYRTLFDGGRQ